MNYTGKRPAPIRKVLAKMGPNKFTPHPMPYGTGKRANVQHWADSHVAFCTQNFRFWSGNSNGQTFSHGERGVNY